MKSAKHEVARTLCEVVSSATKPLYIYRVDEYASQEDRNKTAKELENVVDGGFIVTSTLSDIEVLQPVFDAKTLQRCTNVLADYLEKEI